MSSDPSNGDKLWRDEQLLRELYHEQDMTQTEIAAELGCGEGTVNRWIHEHELDVCSIGSTNEQIRAVDLYELYWEQELSQQEIAERCNCSVGLVSKQMNEQDIPVRGRYDSMPRLFTRQSDGHEFIRHQYKGSRDVIPCHRLVAVAEYGYDEVVGNDVHHKNSIPWDNRVENLSVLDHGKHTTIHNKERDWDSVERSDDGTIIQFN